jgi:hypothetical protein
LVEQLESELPGAITAAVLPNEVGPVQYPPPVAELVARPIADHARVRGAGASHGHAHSVSARLENLYRHSSLERIPMK